MEQPKAEKRRVRIVAISDTHDRLRDFTEEMFPPADIFIHAGDITNESTSQQFQNFRNFLKKLPYKHKIVIGGNHDFGLESTQESYEEKFQYFQLTEDYHVDVLQQRRKLKQVCTYLEHEFVQIEGIKIFGSPYIESQYKQGFYKHPRQFFEIWSVLPQKVDILITHMPPFKILDQIVYGKRNVGSKTLRRAVEIIEPKVHIFGHIHESQGHMRLNKTDFYNVAVLDNNYTFTQSPTIIQLEL